MARYSNAGRLEGRRGDRDVYNYSTNLMFLLQGKRFLVPPPSWRAGLRGRGDAPFVKSRRFCHNRHPRRCKPERRHRAAAAARISI
tara:strand:+ start:467 stop:724 length:258 start_codon:yes stop_codon:yes gene_type:complete